MYIMFAILCLFSAISRRVGAFQICIVIIIKGEEVCRGVCTVEKSVRPLPEVVENLISFCLHPDTQHLQTVWKSNLNRT